MSGAPVFETLGCRLNAWESEAMRALGRRAGFADAVVINTCAVTAEAVRQAKQQIRRARRQHPDRRIVVTGCAAQTEPGTFTAMAEVDHVLGNHEKLTLAAWQRLAGPGAPRLQLSDIMARARPDTPPIDGFGSRSRAFVQVQNGCDHRCTFCIIPHGRGNSRSVPAPVVIGQIARLVAAGYNEVVLTGVDMTGWGADLEGRPRLGDLVQQVLEAVPELARLRISSIDSVEADPALIEAICQHPRLMPHLHLSLQAGDDMILKRMKRRHSRADAIAFCDRLRAARPEITFGADLIAGFPTETEAMFANSLKLVEDCGLTWLHVFPFSPRRGTPAARMPQLDRGTIRARAARLRELGAARVAAHLAARVGGRGAVLMEGARIGRAEDFTRVAFSADQPVGRIVRARFAGVAGDRLLAEGA